MRVLSLFDGLSGGQIALERAGVAVSRYYASEIDEKAMKITNSNYPNTIQLGDVTKLSTNQLLDLDIDLLIGGSPCTNLSFIGNRDGMSTTCRVEIETLDQYLKYKKMKFEFIGQSYLFWEFMRIKSIIKPKYFMLENVKMSNRWKDVFSNAIGVDAIAINSNLLTAQNRSRLYWTNISVSPIKQKNINLKDILDHSQNFRPLGKFMFGMYGKRKRIDLAPKITNRKANCLTTKGCHTTHYYVNQDKTKMRNLTVGEWEKLQTLPVGYTNVAGVSKTHKYKAIGNGWTIDIIAHIFKDLKKYSNRKINKEKRKIIRELDIMSNLSTGLIDYSDDIKSLENRLLTILRMTRTE